MKNTVCWMFFALLACSAAVRAEKAGAPFQGAKELKILVFGASFSHGIMEDLPQISAAAGKKVEVRCLRAGGLKRYSEAIELAEANPTNTDAKAYVNLETDYKAQVRVKDELRSKPWDVVMLQRVSLADKDPDLAAAAAKKICAYIRENAPQAKIAVYQTQAFRGDSEILPQIVPRGWSGKEFTEADSYEATRSLCTRIAKENGALLIPIGDAFELVHHDPVHGWVFPDPDFDYKNPERKGAPKRESNSLAIGFQWIPSGGVGKTGWAYKVDDHPNNLGRCLYGMVCYESLFGESVIGNSYRPKGPTAENALKGTDLDTRVDKIVSEEKILFLQNAAHQAVEALR
jgi:hypothetical protein